MQGSSLKSEGKRGKKSLPVRNILLNEKQIEKRVKELAKIISSDYMGKMPLLIGILKGSFIFLSDLIRFMSIPVEVDFLSVSSYGHSTESQGVIRIRKDLDVDITGRDIIIVEDIIDTGLTLSYIIDLLSARNPTSLRICVLFLKRKERRMTINPHYIGFEIPDVFVVGYGLDFKEKYRGLRFLCTLKEDLHYALS